MDHQGSPRHPPVGNPTFFFSCELVENFSQFIEVLLIFQVVLRVSQQSISGSSHSSRWVALCLSILWPAPPGPSEGPLQSLWAALVCQCPVPPPTMGVSKEQTRHPFLLRQGSFGGTRTSPRAPLGPSDQARSYKRAECGSGVVWGPGGAGGWLCLPGPHDPSGGSRHLCTALQSNHCLA